MDERTDAIKVADALMNTLTCPYCEEELREINVPVREAYSSTWVFKWNESDQSYYFYDAVIGEFSEGYDLDERLCPNCHEDIGDYLIERKKDVTILEDNGKQNIKGVFEQEGTNIFRDCCKPQC